MSVDLDDWGDPFSAPKESTRAFTRPGPQPGQSTTRVITDLHKRIAALEKVEDELIAEMNAALADRNKELERQNLELQRGLMEANKKILELTERLLEITCARPPTG